MVDHLELVEAWPYALLERFCLGFALRSKENSGTCSAALKCGTSEVSAESPKCWLSPSHLGLVLLALLPCRDSSRSLCPTLPSSRRLLPSGFLHVCKIQKCNPRTWGKFNVDFRAASRWLSPFQDFPPPFQLQPCTPPVMGPQTTQAGLLPESSPPCPQPANCPAALPSGQGPWAQAGLCLPQATPQLPREAVMLSLFRLSLFSWGISVVYKVLPEFSFNGGFHKSPLGF